MRHMQPKAPDTENRLGSPEHPTDFGLRSHAKSFASPSFFLHLLGSIFSLSLQALFDYCRDTLSHTSSTPRSHSHSGEPQTSTHFHGLPFSFPRVVARLSFMAPGPHLLHLGLGHDQNCNHFRCSCWVVARQPFKAPGPHLLSYLSQCVPPFSRQSALVPLALGMAETASMSLHVWCIGLLLRDFSHCFAAYEYFCMLFRALWVSDGRLHWEQGPDTNGLKLSCLLREQERCPRGH